MDSQLLQPDRNPFRPLSPIKIVPESASDTKKKPMVELHYNGETKQFCPHHISSMMVSQQSREMKANKRPYFVIPAYFSHLQRLATRRAWASAGITKITLVDEPYAAAVAYYLHLLALKHSYMHVLVFDLGASSLQVSLLANDEKPCLRVKFTSGQTHLGGEDFTNRLLDFLVAEFRTKHGKDVSGDARALRRLRYACEKAKMVLSSYMHAVVEIDSFYEGLDFYASISRARFEELNEDLFKKCIETVRQCIHYVEMQKTEFEHVVLIGGSSWIPKVQQLLEEFFNDKVVRNHKPPDSAVIYGSIIIGASLYRLDSEEESMFEEELLPLGIGIEIPGGIMNEIIPRNTRIPTKEYQIILPASDKQRNLVIHVYQGERARTKDNYFLGTFELKNIPPAPRGVYGINVCIHAMPKGIVEVSAHDMMAGENMGVTCRMGKALSDEQIERMVKDAEKHKAEDELVMKAKAKSCLEGYVYVMRNQMKKAKATNWWKLDVSERDKTEKEIYETMEWVDRDMGKADQYEDKLKELEALWRKIMVKLNTL